MLLSLEIPIAHLKEFLPLTDFGFGLAQLYLDPTQKEYHELMRGCLLDNGMYELGESLSIDELIQAATYCQPKALIAPDWEDDIERTLSAALKCLKASKGKSWTVGALVQGKDLDERLDCFDALQAMHCRPIGFPFRSPRGDTIVRLLSTNSLNANEWYHLFGLRTLEELSLKLPGTWSVDTGKPFKGFRMDQRPIRGHGKVKLHEHMTTDRRYTALWNIAYMRKLMQG